MQEKGVQTSQKGLYKGMQTYRIGKFNITLMEILVGLQKSDFLHGRTLCLQNTVYDTKMNR